MLLNSSQANSYVTLQGRVFWGTTALSQGAAATAQDCQAMCSSNTSCTGATFDSSKQTCYVRGGAGDILSGTEYDYAIMTELQNTTILLKTYNEKLLDLNNQILIIMKKSKPYYDKDLLAKNTLDEDLQQKYYDELTKEREKIHRRLQNYDSVNRETLDTGIQVKQTALVYRIFVIILGMSLIVLFFIYFNIAAPSPNPVFILLLTSFIVYALGMTFISALIAFFTILFVILR